MVKHFSKPKFFPFPAYKAPRPSALRANQWAPQLISSAQTTSLYSQEPWKILDQSIEPISFRVTWCFKELVETYRAFKDRHRQALLKSTHLTSISSRQRKADPELAEFCEARRQRRSRSRPRWKSVLRLYTSKDDQQVLRLVHYVGTLLFTLPGLVRANIVVPCIRMKDDQNPKLDHCLVTS